MARHRAPEDAAVQKLHGELAALSTRWGFPAALLLADGPRRFSEVARGLDGVSSKVLTQTLRTLEVTGVVEGRRPGAGHSVYALTPRGEDLVQTLLATVDRPAVVAAA